MYVRQLLKKETINQKVSSFEAHNDINSKTLTIDMYVLHFDYYLMSVIIASLVLILFAFVLTESCNYYSVYENH